MTDVKHELVTKQCVQCVAENNDVRIEDTARIFVRSGRYLFQVRVKISAVLVFGRIARFCEVRNWHDGYECHNVLYSSQETD